MEAQHEALHQCKIQMKKADEWCEMRVNELESTIMNDHMSTK